MGKLLDVVLSATEPGRHSLWIDAGRRSAKYYGAAGWQELSAGGASAQAAVESIPDETIDAVCV